MSQMLRKKFVAILRTACPTRAREEIEIKTLIIAVNIYRVLVLCQASAMCFANIISVVLITSLRVTCYYTHVADAKTEEQRNSINLPKLTQRARIGPE